MDNANFNMGINNSNFGDNIFKQVYPPNLKSFGNIDFGITRWFESQGPKLGGNFYLIVVLSLNHG